MDKQQLLKQLEKAWETFNESYAGLSDSKMTEPGVVCRISIRFFLPITFRRTVLEQPVEQIDTMRHRMSPAT